jgi:hypothetical protein
MFHGRFTIRSLQLAFTLCLALCFRGAPIAHAASAPYTVTENELLQSFPETLTFSLELGDAQDVRAIRLLYGSTVPSCNPGVAKASAEFEQGTRVTAKWEWDLKKSAQLAPGAEVWWQWEVTDAAGVTTQTSREVTRVIDTRHRWQKTGNDRITINWVTGDKRFGEQLLDISDDSLTQIALDYGVTATRDMQIWIYPTNEALRDTLPFAPEWTGGIALSAHNAVLTSIDPKQIGSWARDVIPHEIAHLVVGARMFNCSGAFLPTWLNEGLAVHAENGTDSISDIKRALENRRILSLRSLAGEFASDPELARLNYAFSGAIVAYLVREHGGEKISALLADVRDGAPIDEAMQRVYGFDTDGLDLAWRAANGVRRKPVLAPKATATPSTRAPRPRRTPAPTRVPFDPNATRTP